MRLSVQDCAFDYGRKAADFAAAAGNLGAGAVVTFCGIMRGSPKTVAEMIIEHYPGMTEKAISTMMDQAVERWSLDDVLIIHRYGRLIPGDIIMMVATASRHRADAFAAADYLMDYLKSRAPFWKKEFSATGQVWVVANAADEAALARW